MTNTGLDGRSRDDDGRIRAKRDDTLVRTLAETYPEIQGAAAGPDARGCEAASWNGQSGPDSSGVAKEEVGTASRLPTRKTQAAEFGGLSLLQEIRFDTARAGTERTAPPNVGSRRRFLCSREMSRVALAQWRHLDAVTRTSGRAAPGIAIVGLDRWHDRFGHQRARWRRDWFATHSAVVPRAGGRLRGPDDAQVEPREVDLARRATASIGQRTAGLPRQRSRRLVSLEGASVLAGRLGWLGLWATCGVFSARVRLSLFSAVEPVECRWD